MLLVLTHGTGYRANSRSIWGYPVSQPVMALLSGCEEGSGGASELIPLIISLVAKDT